MQALQTIQGVSIDTPSQTRPMPRQADTEADLLVLWTRNRAARTKTEYLRIIRQFREACDTPLPMLTLRDLHAFDETLVMRGVSVSSRVTRLTVIRSLLSFAHRTGFLPFNIGVAFTLPKCPSTLASRILDEEQVHRLLAAEASPRNRLLLRLLYSSALRVEEISALYWRNLTPHGDGGHLVVENGKGSKARTVLLPPSTWRELQAFRGEAAPDAPVFPSRNGGKALSKVSVWRVVKQAAARAGVPAGVSPHWLRHSHASHSLDRGCPISLVSSTLGHASIATTGRYLHARTNDSSALYLGV